MSELTEKLVIKWVDYGFIFQDTPNKESIAKAFELVSKKLASEEFNPEKNTYHPKITQFIFPVLYRIGIYIELNDELTNLILHEFIINLKDYDESLTIKYREHNVDYEVLFLSAFADHFIINFKNKNNEY